MANETAPRPTRRRYRGAYSSPRGRTGGRTGTRGRTGGERGRTGTKVEFTSRHVLPASGDDPDGPSFGLSRDSHPVPGPMPVPNGAPRTVAARLSSRETDLLRSDRAAPGIRRDRDKTPGREPVNRSDRGRRTQRIGVSVRGSPGLRSSRFEPGSSGRVRRGPPDGPHGGRWPSRRIGAPSGPIVAPGKSGRTGRVPPAGGRLHGPMMIIVHG